MIAFQMMAGPYDIVISDITRDNSPESGWDLLRDIRDQSPDKPFVFYVGFVDSHRRQEALAKGATAITASPHELLETVVELLTSRPQSSRL